MSNSNVLSTIRKFVGNNSPAILSYLGITGVVATSILSVRAGMKVQRTMDDWIVNEEETKVEKYKRLAKATWKVYIPPVTMATATIACIFLANKESQKRYLALSAAYLLSDESFRSYREKVKDVVGIDKEEEVHEKVVKEQMEKSDTSQVIITGKGDHLCYDTLTGRYFKSNIEDVRKAVNEINANVINNVYASQNDFYSLIGLPPTGYGEEVGWRTDNLMDVQFTSHLSEDGQPCLALNYTVAPIRGYFKGHY